MGKRKRGGKGRREAFIAVVARTNLLKALAKEAYADWNLYA